MAAPHEGPDAALAELVGDAALAADLPLAGDAD